VIVGEQAGATVYEQGTERTPLQIATWAPRAGAQRRQGRADPSTPPDGCTSTAELMDELVAIRDATRADQVLLVVDAMTGPGRRSTWAEQFAAAVAFDGVVLSKLDGDARAAPRCRCAR